MAASTAHKTVNLTISDILYILREINLENRTQFIEDRDDIEPVVWCREFCTIHLDLGRRTEKTRYAISEATENDCIVVFNKHWGEIGFKKSKAKILSPKCVLNLKGEVFDTIYIDEPEHVFKEITRNKLYEKLVEPSHEQTFILLGE